MPSANQMLSSVAEVAVSTATNATCAVTITAPTKAQFVIALYGVIITANAAPAAAVEATIAGLRKPDGTASLTSTIELPAAAFAPIQLGFGTHPPLSAPSTDLVVSVPALGSGVKCTLTVLYSVVLA